MSGCCAAALLSPKKCERCSLPAPKGERYCPLHRWKLLQEMRRTGYLTNTRFPVKYRGEDSREDIRETKFGVDN